MGVGGEGRARGRGRDQLWAKRSEARCARADTAGLPGAAVSWAWRAPAARAPRASPHHETTKVSGAAATLVLWEPRRSGVATVGSGVLGAPWGP